MDSHAVTDSSADTIRFLDLFQIPVSRAEFDHSIKSIHFFLTFSSRIHTFFILFLHQFLPFFPSIPQNPGSQAWDVDSNLCSLRQGKPGGNLDPGGLWKEPGLWGMAAGGHEITGWGMAWGMGLGQSAAVRCCEHLTNFLKIVPARQFENYYSITNQGAAPCLRLSGKPRCTYDLNQPGILVTRHWPSLQGQNMPSRLQSWILVGTCQTPSTMSWRSSVFGQIA